MFSYLIKWPDTFSVGQETYGLNCWQNYVDNQTRKCSGMVCGFSVLGYILYSVYVAYGTPAVVISPLYTWSLLFITYVAVKSRAVL